MADTNFQLAIRQSILNKVAIYLQTGLRDMTIPLSFNNGIADFVFENTTYGISPLEAGQSPLLPGINIQFLDEEDVATGRSHSTKKRYILPARIIVSKPILANNRPQVIKAEVLKVCKLILKCLADGYVQIWDYTDLSNPINTGIRGTYNREAYSFIDQSLAIPGGDIRMVATIFVNYADLSL